MKQDIKAESSHSTCNAEVECGITSRLLTLKGEYSESKFARKCNIPISTMRKYLSGSMPGLDKALQISEALGVNIQWLSTGKGPKWASESQEEGARESSIDHSDDLYWSDSKSEQAIIDLLESTEKELNRVGQFPVTEAELNKNQILRDAKFQLSVLYSSPGMYPELKGQIELMLRLAFADPAIERSAADAMKKTHTRLKRASMLIETVSEAIGWEPPLDIKEAMKTAIFNDDLSEETVLRLMDAIYRAIQKGND